MLIFCTQIFGILCIFYCVILIIENVKIAVGYAEIGAMQFQLVLNKQDAMTEFDTLDAGRFQAIRSGTRVTYTEKLSEDRSQLSGVFISDKRLSAAGDKERAIALLVAEKGHQEIQADGSHYLVLDLEQI